VPSWLPAAAICVGFSLAIVNQLRVQLFGRETVMAAARKVHRLYTEKTLPAKRGDIVSADGRLLARSTNRCRLGIDPKRVPISPAFWNEIARVCGLSAAELLDYATRRGSGNNWDVTLSSQQTEQIEAIRSRYGVDGVWLEPAGAREYPLGESAAPLIGFVEGHTGIAGLERSQNEQLEGKDGNLVGMTDRTGNFLPWMTRDSSAPVDGQDIVLTIESDLQIAVMKKLKAQCEMHKAARGAAIVMSKSGEILALASWPSYDPKRAADAQQDMARGATVSPQINPAIGMRFEPGSTFKIFTIALGLQDGIISPHETVLCTGSKPFFNRTIHCAGDHAPKAHGAVDADKCVEVSCNVTAATWGARIGFEKLLGMVRDLGLLEKQDLGLNPETTGYVRPDDFNKTIQSANIGFGQAINVTPIGLAAAFGVFANDGMRVAPRLVRFIGGKPWPVKAPVRVFQPEIAHEMLRKMEKVVQGEHGTGKALRIPGYILAGKTGTAQKLGSGLAGRRYVSSFVGYVPARDPKAVVLVMIDDPKQNGFYGAVVAGPVFKETAKFLLKSYKIPHMVTEKPVAAK
jgi:cell division protein FtsI/penicillin-binding protein 2